jgi:hypothetical protein
MGPRGEKDSPAFLYVLPENPRGYFPTNVPLEITDTFDTSGII